MRVRRSTSRGDTIVEVMIAIAIVSMVISLSYAMASRSLSMGQRAQERSEALKLAEGQLELLKAYGGNQQLSDIYKVPAPESFCMLINGSRIDQKLVPQNITDENIRLASTATPDLTSPYHDNCRDGVGQRYFKSITRDDVDLQSTFVVRIRWDRLGGGYDEVALAYKLHKGQY